MSTRGKLYKRIMGYCGLVSLGFIYITSIAVWVISGLPDSGHVR